jgi:hypothetical protein
VHDAYSAFLSGLRDRMIRFAALRGALSGTSLAAICCGPAMAAGALVGIPGAGPWAYAVLCAAGAALGAWREVAKGTSYSAAARLADEGLGTAEVLSAALLCSARGCGGRFDPLIMARAEEISAKKPRVEIGFSSIWKRALRVAALAAAGALVAALPGTLGMREFLFASGHGKAGTEGEQTVAGAASPGRGEMARAIANSLFPDDARLARAAERSISSGRLDQLRDMLSRADADLGKRIAKSDSLLERERLERERQALRDAAAKAMEQMAQDTQSQGEQSTQGLSQGQGQGLGQGSQGQPEGSDTRSSGKSPGGAEGDRTGGPQGTNPNENGSGQSGQDPAPGGQGQPGEGQDSGQGADQSGSASEQGGTGVADGAGQPRILGGSAAGRGSGSAKDWGKIDPRSDPNRSAVLKNDESGLMELVLPGTEAGRAASAPMAALKSAEATMARDRVPLGYQDFTRAYFLSLANMAEGENR